MKIICVNDGTPFEATRATARFCSERCKKAYARKVKSGWNPGDASKYPGDSNNVNPQPAAGIETFHAVDRGDIPLTVKKNARGAKALTLKKVETKAADGLPTKAEMIKRLNERLAARGAPLIEEHRQPTQFIPTGIDALDALTADADELKVGGFPRKHITEIFGPKGTGKTSLMNLIADNTDGLRVLYVDVEGGLIAPKEHIIVSNASTVDDVETMVFEALREEYYDLIIVDSVAALSSAKEVEDAKSGFMTKAKDMARFIRRINAIIRPIGDDGYPKKTPGTAVVFINQLRDTGNSFGVMEFTPGGRSIEYAASLRLELRSAKADKIVKDGANVGQNVRVKVEKSRFGAPGLTTKFKIMYGDLL
jgi:RecA/RadA recombinase